MDAILWAQEHEQPKSGHATGDNNCIVAHHVRVQLFFVYALLSSGISDIFAAYRRVLLHRYRLYNAFRSAKNVVCGSVCVHGVYIGRGVGTGVQHC